MKRRIKKAKVKFLSFCPRGANQLRTVYKEDGSFSVESLVKASPDFNEQGELFACVYAPEFRDSQGDIASAPVIKEMMYDAAKEGLSLDLRHNEEPLAKADAFIAESFVIQKDDPRFADMSTYDGSPVDVTGGWGVVLKIDNPVLREKYRQGEWAGISLSGMAAGQIEKHDSDEAPGWFNSFLQKIGFKNLQISGDIEMTGDELKAILTENNKAIVTGFASVMAKMQGVELDDEGNPKAPATKTEKGDAAFEGEITPKNLKKHALKLRKEQVVKGLDWTDTEAIKKAEEELASIQAEEEALAQPKSDSKDDDLSEEEVAAGIAKEDSSTVRDLKLRLFKEQKRSNQPPTGSKTEKSDTDSHVALGQAMAEEVNKRRGYAS